VLGWELGRRLDTRLTLAALERALALRGDVGGVIHHSDQGVQYAAHGYVRRAQAAGLILSMSRRAQPQDNARMESFFATLKAEEVRLTEYRDLEDARASLARFIDDLYNTKRLHSALGYVPPLEFESAERSTPILRSGADSNSVSPQGFANAMPNLSLPPALRDALYLPEPANPIHATVY